MKLSNSSYNLNVSRAGVGSGLFMLVLCSLLMSYWSLQYFLKKSLDSLKKSVGKMSTILSFFNCLSAGVFITTGLLDIFPEVTEKFSQSLTQLQIETNFPLSAFVVMCGLFLIMYIEAALHALQDWVKRRHAKRGFSTQRGTDNSSCIDHNAGLLEYNTFDHPNNTEPKSNDLTTTVPMNSLSIVVLVIALSTHSVFEGLALGLQNSSKELLLLFLALSFHKVVISITIGLEMAQMTLTNSKVIVCTLIFAVASPIGLLAGSMLQSMQYHNHGNQAGILLTSAVLEGLACGTFFFIVFFEILPRELRSPTSSFSRIVALSLGFIIVSLLIFLTH